MKSVLSVAVLGLFVALACGTTAKADTVGTLTLTDCGGGGGAGCPGATYMFDIGTTSASLTITINGAVGSTNDFITAVDLGFSPSNTVTITGFTAPSSGWSATTGSLSSGGSCGVNSGAFVCSSASPLTSLMISTGGTYTWTWDYTLAAGTSIDAVGDVHIGTEYGPNQGNFNGLIVSQTGATGTTSAPEPASLALLGTGLLGLVGFARRRFQNS